MSRPNQIAILLLTVFQLFHFSAFGQSSERMLSLKRDLASEKNDSVRLYLMSEIAFEYEAFSLETAIQWYDQGITLAKKKNSAFWLSKNYGYKAIVLQFMLKYDSAIIYNQRAILFAEKIKDTLQQSKMHSNLGKTYFENDKVVSALQSYRKGLSLAEKIKNEQLIAHNYRGIGVCFRKMNNHKFSLIYYKKALKIDLALNSMSDLARDYANIAVAYQDLSEWSKANVYFNKAIKIYEEMNTQGEELAILYNNKASVETENKNHKEALELFFKAKQQFMLSKEKGSIPFVNKNISSCYLALNQLDLAKRYIDSALVDFSIKSNPRMRIQAQMILAEILMKQGKHSEASKLLLKTYNQKDSLEASYQKREIQELEIKFQTKEKDIQLKQSEAERKEKDAELSLQKSINQRRLIFVVGLVGVGVLLLFLFLNVRKTNNQTKQANERIEQQKKVIEEKNHEITSSIRYAQSIQNAILPPQPIVDSYFKSNFVLFLPKDIVAGDFYWFEQQGDHIFFAAADCTGHGVPGAMVSVVCHNALNQAVGEYQLTNSAKILDKTRELVIKTFEKSEVNIKDGMDIALCVINASTNELQFSGANNSLLIIREGEVIKLKADRHAIGYSDEMHPFNAHTFQLKSKDRIYAYSDGFSDLFGGPSARLGSAGKKFLSKNLENLLLSIQDLVLSEQKKVVLDTFNQWKGDNEQTDDVCMVAVEIE